MLCAITRPNIGIVRCSSPATLRLPPALAWNKSWLDGVRFRTGKLFGSWSDDQCRIRAAITEKTIDLLREANPQVDVQTVLDAGHNIHFAHFEAFMPLLEQFLIEPAAVS